MLGMAPTQRNRELSNAVVVQALRAVVCRRPPNPYATKIAQSRPESRAQFKLSSACSQFGSLTAILTQNAGPSRANWASPVKFGPAWPCGTQTRMHDPHQFLTH